MSKLPWYHEGVNFECTGCGKCCTGGPGAVWISEDEAIAISSYLKLSIEEFYSKYTRLLDGRRALCEVGPEFDCIFLKEKKFCAIYPTRPVQCQTFPFWPGVMASKQRWEEAKSYCEGIRQDAPLISKEKIEAELKRHGPKSI